MIENKLVAGLDIDLSSYGLGIIKQPKIKDLINLPYPDDEILLPLFMIEQYFEKYYELGLGCKKVESRIHLLELLEKVSTNYIADLSKKEKQTKYFDKYINNKKYYTFGYKGLELLKLLYACTDDDILLNIDDEYNLEIIIKDKCVITQDNFDILVKVIFKIFDIDINNLKFDTGDEWVEATGSKREKKLIEKFKEKERKRQEKNKLHLCDYITYIVVDSNIDYETILNWSYFQLMHTYKALAYKNRQVFEEHIFASGMLMMDAKDITNWRKEVKMVIDKSIY